MKLSAPDHRLELTARLSLRLECPQLSVGQASKKPDEEGVHG